MYLGMTLIKVTARYAISHPQIKKSLQDTLLVTVKPQKVDPGGVCLTITLI